MCQNSISGGYSDWRLPTIEELIAIYQNLSKKDEFNPSEPYWTSEKSSEMEPCCVDLNDFKISYCGVDDEMPARCVRSLK